MMEKYILFMLFFLILLIIYGISEYHLTKLELKNNEVELLIVEAEERLKKLEVRYRELKCNLAKKNGLID